MTTDGTGDRVAGALVGLAAGDARGAGYEFGPPPAELARLALMAAGRSAAPGDLPEDLLSNGSP